MSVSLDLSGCSSPWAGAGGTWYRHFRALAFHLIVDQEEADGLGIYDPAEIAERYGIPQDKVELYRHEWPVG